MYRVPHDVYNILVSFVIEDLDCTQPWDSTNVRGNIPLSSSPNRYATARQPLYDTHPRMTEEHQSGLQKLSCCFRLGSE